jgi:hypothetical protein
VAGLQARSPLRSAHPLFSLNKLVSLTAFLLLLGAGWVALCYIKNEMIARSLGSTDSSSTAKTTAARMSEARAAGINQLSTPARLVYSCAGDQQYYHAATHLPEQCERTALNEDAALQRGLKQCKACIPH